MPYFDKYRKEHVKTVMMGLKDKIYETVGVLHADVFVTPEPVSFADKATGECTTIKDIQIGQKWGKIWDCGWFHVTGKVDSSLIGRDVVALIDISGEACIFSDDGCPIRGLTCVDSQFSTELGMPGKRVYQLATPLQKEMVLDIDFWMDAGCNDLFGEYKGDGTMRQLHIAICHENRRKLFYDMQVLYDLADCLEEKSARRQRLEFKLYDAANAIYTGTDEEIKIATDILAPELAKQNGDPDLTLYAIGHAHIDLAWLWPIRETIRKGARTFATVIANMERYPDYKFGASQPQLFAWVKEFYPALYEKIKVQVAKGRFEPQGAMWVEADTNVSGGEALVRQIMHGKRWFMDEFDFDVNNLWLPDVFGYTAALPQLLKKSNVDYFMTQKLSWSLHNKFPHQTFNWVGIDGTAITTHMLPEETYNSGAYPHSIKNTEKNYKDVGISDKALMLFGIGDGGGGPNTDHLERLDREKNLSGIIPVKQQWGSEFLEEIGKDADKYPSWVGELYLERHQGTLTTQAKNKWYNRKMENALREAEFALVLADCPECYPQERLEEIWKEVLLYQFHDIIPGSSIDRVYDESLERYKELYNEVNALIKTTYQSIADKVATKKGEHVLFNSLAWDRNELVEVDGQTKLVTIPSMGYTTISDQEEVADISAQITQNSIENLAVKVIFDESGAITSIYNKLIDVQAVKAGEKANRLAVYDDFGDCWDIPVTYMDKAPKYFVLQSQKASVVGNNAVMEQVYTFGDSKLVQKIKLGADKLRVDFETFVDWKESHKMLRASFPTDIIAETATFDIQYGAIKRSNHENTSWDKAQFEVCGIKWADISNSNYGVALLNDCKYGYRVKNSVLDLNLLRSARYPGKTADIGTHEFTYSIYPHGGDCATGQVMLEGYELNVPVWSVKAEKVSDKPVSAHSFMNIEGSAVVEAIKKAEDSIDTVVRIYEYTGAPDNMLVQFNKTYKRIEMCNLLEDVISVVGEDTNTIEMPIGAFEIVTLKLVQ